MNDPMHMLSADHREVEELLNHLGETEQGPERAQLLAEVTKKLTNHMEIEESIVYPMIRELVSAGDEEESDVEHELVREVLGKLDLMVDVPGFRSVVEMLAGGLRHHVEQEERAILPELMHRLRPGERDAMGDAIAEAHCAGAPLRLGPRGISDLPRANAFSPSRWAVGA